MGEIRDICVNIPLFQATKNVPLYVKVVYGLLLKKPRRKEKDPKDVHVIG